MTRVKPMTSWFKMLTLCRCSTTTALRRNVFTCIPCSYTRLPLDGVARNYIFLYFIYLDMQESNLWCLDPLIPTSYAWGEKKNHSVWAGIEPRSLCFICSQSTALTTRPCLFGLEERCWNSLLFRSTTAFFCQKNWCSVVSFLWLIS